MKINQWRNVRRPLSFSLHPSRVWKWSVVENLPVLCAVWCYDSSYRCTCSTFPYNNTSLWPVLSGSRNTSVTVWLFHGAFGSGLTARGICELSRIKHEKSVFLKKKKTWVWVNNQNIHFEPILHLLLEITKTYWWYIYYDRLFPPSNTNLNFLSYNSEFVSHNYDFFILQLQVINLLFWVYISQFWHVFICSYLVILASFFLWIFSLHLAVQFLCFHHKDDLHKWTNCLWFFYLKTISRSKS